MKETNPGLELEILTQLSQKLTKQVDRKAEEIDMNHYQLDLIHVYRSPDLRAAEHSFFLNAYGTCGISLGFNFHFGNS